MPTLLIIMSELINYHGLNITLTPSQIALYTNPVSTLARVQTKINSNQFIFNHEVTPKYSITDQKSSGRCWLFATVNTIRVVAGKNLDVEPKDLEFSQTYLYFYDKLERYHRNLRYYLKLKTVTFDPTPYKLHLFKEAMGDGGQWDMAKEIVKKYGIVPKYLMPDSMHSKSSAGMNSFLMQMLKLDFAKLDNTPHNQIEDTIKSMVDKVYNILVGFLGLPPTNFSWVYTSSKGIQTIDGLDPHKLLELTKFNPDDWVSVVNDPRQSNPYDKYYQVEYLGNVFDTHVGWINLPIDRLKQLTKASIDANLPVWFGCDVGAERDKETGIMDVGIFDYQTMYGINFDLTKEQKLMSYSSLPSHAMVIVGYHGDFENVTRWKIENSWGKSSGTDGYLLMTDAWYSDYVYQIVVHKSLLDTGDLAIGNNVYKYIPPWDPLGTLA